MATELQAPSGSGDEVADSSSRSALPGLLGADGLSAKEKYAERMKKLRDLHMKRNEARSAVFEFLICIRNALLIMVPVIQIPVPLYRYQYLTSFS